MLLSTWYLTILFTLATYADLMLLNVYSILNNNQIWSFNDGLLLGRSNMYTCMAQDVLSLLSVSLSLNVFFFFLLQFFLFLFFLELHSAVPQSSIKSGSRAETRSTSYLDFGLVSSSLMQKLESRFTQWQDKIPAQHPANVFLSVLCALSGQFVWNFKVLVCPEPQLQSWSVCSRLRLPYPPTTSSPFLSPSFSLGIVCLCSCCPLKTGRSVYPERDYTHNL